MGIYDRDYYRDTPPRGGFGHFYVWSATTWLIVINVAVLFANGMLHRAVHRPIDPEFDDMMGVQTVASAMGPIAQWAYFSTDKAIFGGQLWRLVTFQFVHTQPWPLVVNLMGIFFFGPIVEGHFGSRRYLAFYLLCGVAGAMCDVILGLARVLPDGAATPLMGASGGVFGLLVAAAMIAPDVQVFYYFFPVTIRLLAIVAMGMAVYSIFAVGNNAGGEAAHLGGGVLGFAFMKNQHWLSPFAPRRRSVTGQTSPPRRRRAKAFQKDWSKDFNR